MPVWTAKGHFILGMMLGLLVGLLVLGIAPSPGHAQDAQSAPASSQADSDAQAPDPLDEKELQVLVARIALYPDELVALVSAASLYPLQVVEAARYLDQYAKDKSLKPKDSWDGSVISLLNYPEIVKMMSEDLDWTQSLGSAITYQQKDVLVAIQQLRDEAVSDGVIKTDDKVTVTTKNNNVVIAPTNPEKIYVPQYEPQMLYAENYAPAPIDYYPEPYPSYYYPGATFFAGAVTGALWAAAVDWDDWGVWGGGWRGGDVDIDVDCDHCMNNINGKVNFNDIDWKKVDRSKLHFDKDQFSKIDRNKISNDLRSNRDNNLRNKASDIRGDRRPGGRGSQVTDVRKSTLEGLKSRPEGRPGTRPGGDRAGQNRPNAGRPGDASRPNASRPGGGSRPSANRPAASKAKPKVTHGSRPSSRPKPAAQFDRRPQRPSGLGEMRGGRVSHMSSSRGHYSMGGGHRGGGGQRHMRGGGGRRR